MGSREPTPSNATISLDYADAELRFKFMNSKFVIKFIARFNYLVHN